MVSLPRVKDWIREIAISFCNSSKASDYQLIKKLGEYQYDQYDPINKFRRPKDFLNDGFEGNTNLKYARDEARQACLATTNTRANTITNPTL